MANADSKTKVPTIVPSDDVQEMHIHLHPEYERNLAPLAHKMNQAAEAAEMPYVQDSFPKSDNGHYFSPDQGAVAIRNACLKLFGTEPTPLPMGRNLPYFRPVDVQRNIYIGPDYEEIYENDLLNPRIWTAKRLQDYIKKNIPDYQFPEFDLGRDYRAEFLDVVKKALIITGTKTETVQYPFQLIQYPGNDDIQVLALAEDPNDFNIDHEGEVFHLAIKAKMKDRHLVDALYKAVIDELENANLFKGRCFEFDANGRIHYINPFEGMDPMNLVFSQRVTTNLDRQILSVIRNHDKALAVNSELLGTKALLSGKPGTGKSEAMKLIQQTALQYGWTAASLAAGATDFVRNAFFKFIEPLDPVVIIREDIETDEPDRETGTAKQIAEARSKQLAISDGIMNKGKKRMLIATTNDEEALSTASIRPGRIDVYIKIERPDREAFKRLITMQCGDLLPADVDLDSLWGEYDEKPEREIRQVSVHGLAGIPAPFLTNGLVETVQRFALDYDLGERVTQEDMYWILDSVSNHADLYARLEAKENAFKKDSLEEVFVDTVQKAVNTAPVVMELANK
jgi:hypothetical protein